MQQETTFSEGYFLGSVATSVKVQLMDMKIKFRKQIFSETMPKRFSKFHWRK